MDKILLQENVENLKRAVGSWADHRLVIMTAAQFTAKAKKIDGKDFMKMANALKKSVSIFSPLRNIYLPVTGLMLTNERIQDDEISRLHSNYEKMRAEGFRSSEFTYIAAYLMEDYMDVGRVKAIYEGMKKYHHFLTSYDDYPAATIIAKQEGEITDLLEISEQYYQALNKNGFYKGNDLQFLANMLVMKGSFNQELVHTVITATDELRRNGIKVKQMHYPSLGVIALAGNIQEVVSYTIELRELKAFKWYKDMAIIAAAVFMSQEYIDASPGLTAAMQLMIQAQQAAIAASAAAAGAAAASSSGN